MKLKLAGLLIGMSIIFAAGAYYADEINAQDKTYKVGDKGPAGGRVFYDKGKYSNGWRYLEAAPEDQGKAKWGCFGQTIQGAKGTAIGTGKINTRAIIQDCGETGIAAKVAVSYRGGGKSDWFLPSKDELDLMYSNLKKAEIGDFVNNNYWSSSDYDNYAAWYQSFRQSSRYHIDKGSALRVRAVRAF